MKSYPEFNAFIYSLESFVPLVKFDQSDNWKCDANRGTRWCRRLAVGSLLRCYWWLHIISGWVLKALWVGAVTESSISASALYLSAPFAVVGLFFVRKVRIAGDQIEAHLRLCLGASPSSAGFSSESVASAQNSPLRPG